MSFDDLPADWPDRPLDEPHLVSDVLDLVVSIKDRLAGGLAVLICDDEHRLVQPCMISELDHLASHTDRQHALANVVEVMEGQGSLLVAIARAEGLSITADDHAWARAMWRACTGDVELFGVHVVTVHGSREVPFERTAA